MNLLELQNKIHQQNKEIGWWDNPRPFSTFVCLFHSELSEAMEGDRKGLMDDHLPQYTMFQVELADFVIRCLDWLGFQYSNGAVAVMSCNVESNSEWGVTQLLACLHGQVSDAYAIYHADTISMCMEKIEQAVKISLDFADENGFDLKQIILEKVEYNRHRADHKRENRAKEGGKKY